MKFSKNNEKLCDWSNTRNIIGNISIVIYSISKYFLFYFHVCALVLSVCVCMRVNAYLSNLKIFRGRVVTNSRALLSSKFCRARFEFDDHSFWNDNEIGSSPRSSSRFSNFLSLPFRLPSVIYACHCSSFLRRTSSVATIKIELEQRGKEESVAHPLRWQFRVKYRFSLIGCEIFESVALRFLTPRIDSPRLQLRLSRSAMG